MFEAFLLTGLAWGVLAFGAVYPWAYVPLLVWAVAAGLWGLAAGRNSVSPALVAALGLVGAVMIAQTIPVPMDTVDRVQRDEMIQQAAVLAVLVFETAQRDEKLPRKALPSPQPARGGEGGAATTEER